MTAVASVEAPVSGVAAVWDWASVLLWVLEWVLDQALESI
jgi:hypothetical protein